MMIMMLKARLALAPALMLATLTACSGAETPSSSGALNESTSAQALCVRSFEKQRECTDTFLPALVDARVRLDKPAGIAAADKESGREALVAQAREEWKNDSTDTAINDTCAGMIAHGMGTPEMSAAVSSCLEAPSCADFVPCQIKIIEGHLAAK